MNQPAVGVVRGLNLAQLVTQGNAVPSSPTLRQQPQQPPPLQASSSDDALSSVISSLSLGGSNYTFYVKISFNDDSKETASSPAVEGVTEVYEWNFFHKKQIVPTLSLLPTTGSSPPTSPRASSSSSSNPVPTIVTFEVYLRKKRNILPSVLFGDAKDTLLASTNVDLKALTEQQVTQMWLPLANVPSSASSSSSSVPMQGVPKLLVKVLKLAAGRATTQPEFEAVDPLPEGVVSMTTEL